MAEYDFGLSLQKVREVSPFVQCITNIVTVNDCANIILAAGGSPAMTMDIREVREGIEGMDALVCNMGAIDFTDSMLVAGTRANELDKPVVLDPVACGTTALRRDAGKQLLSHIHFSMIRGNASEIRALISGEKGGSGVDVSEADRIDDEILQDQEKTRKFLAPFQDFAAKHGTVIIVSGPSDIVTDGKRTALVQNGCATMSRITGSGCMVTSMAGAFAAANREDPFRGAVSCMAVMGIAGDIAEEKRLEKHTGNATFRTDLIDAVFNLTPKDVNRRIKVRVL